MLRQVHAHTGAFDLGIFDQALRHYAHFQPPYSPIKGDHYNLLGDHFHPLIAVLAPLYWIWDTPIVLLVAQSVLVTASVPVVYAIARRRLRPSGSLGVAFTYGVGWALQAMVAFDFHEIAFAVPLLALALDGLDRGSDRELVIPGLLLLLVREDMGLVVAVIGLVRSFRRPRRVGIGLIVVGIAAYEVTTRIAIPHFASDHEFAYWQYDALGPNLTSALGHIARHPIAAIQLFFTPEQKLRTILFLVLPLALLCFRSRYALIALPLLAECFFASRANLWKMEYHYDVLPWLILVVATIDAAARFGIWRHTVGRRMLLTWLVAVSVFLVAVPMGAPRRLQDLLTGTAARSRPETQAELAAVRRMPAGVCVAVSNNMAPQLTSRDLVTVPRGPVQTGTDFILLDMVQSNTGPPHVTPRSVLVSAVHKGYVVVWSQGPVTVLRSPDYHGPSARCGPVSSR